MSFNEDQIAKLSAPLLRTAVRQRAQAGRQLSYLEGWHCIAEANRIFGFDGWDRQTTDLRECGEPRQVGDKWRVAFMCRVRVTVVCGARDLIRDGTGYGSGIDKDLGQAYESAIKEAETDAMKRALMTFGNPFGLALYDKDQANVVDMPSAPEPSRSELIADAMIEQLAKRSGEQAVSKFLDHEKVKADIGLMDRADFDRVMAVAEERRSSPAARAVS